MPGCVLDFFVCFMCVWGGWVGWWVGGVGSGTAHFSRAWVLLALYMGMRVEDGLATSLGPRKMNRNMGARSSGLVPIVFSLFPNCFLIVSSL